ncbi:2-amino-4-hydroxy-6-hydroxymethyldihydropteridine diphosphokinase [Demequina lutea]|uniref:Bifunctional folate synthesis protein n=1 Tax=Demequina lutea TaxID=431489 RepID=A0A7Z0CJ82_9MICO|nr:2-amino-4-hydroxy-6-hydroxymethyldihydropteridine diphosphokinase [Demequina lutea]NYI40470.1 dihydroneopterin aldolase/2-amino-4-hydroxy-6-hydroxymethyldihydropteridine diphosphokinase [Demequina lutea]
MTWTSGPYMRAGIELDRISVEGIRVTAHHGVLDTERSTGQVFFADVVAHVSTRAAAAKDDLSKAVDYSEIADRAAAVLGGDPSYLIETVAEHVALAVLDMDGVYCVEVRVHKPQAPLHVEFKDVTVAIRRDVRTGGLWADKRIGSSAGMPDDPLDLFAQAPVRDQFDQRPVRAVPALLALGGNIGDVEPTLRAAVDDLSRITGIDVIATSPLYASTPVGGPPQPNYLNAVVRIRTILSPREVLGACQGIEMVHGRERQEANGPRTLDIDIIDFDGAEATASDLTLPHPRAHERAFVLVPWYHLEPDATLPGAGPIAPLASAVHTTVSVVANPWPSPSRS